MLVTSEQTVFHTAMISPEQPVQKFNCIPFMVSVPILASETPAYEGFSNNIFKGEMYKRDKYHE